MPTYDQCTIIPFRDIYLLLLSLLAVLTGLMFSSSSEDEHHAGRQNDRQEQDDVTIKPAKMLNNTFIHLISFNEMPLNKIRSPLMKLSRSLHELSRKLSVVIHLSFVMLIGISLLSTTPYKGLAITFDKSALQTSC